MNFQYKNVDKCKFIGVHFNCNTKKCIIIVSNNTIRINEMLPHTKHLFRKLRILNVFKTYTHITTYDAMIIIQRSIPHIIIEMFALSNRCSRIILPSFSLNAMKNLSFKYNSAIQMKSISGDDSWLPCNHNIFSTITL